MNTFRSITTWARQLSRRASFALGGLALSLALMGSTAHAAPVSGISVDRPCWWNLCLDNQFQSDGSLTAWSLWDIGPTPYYISIFNETTGAQLAICGTGTSCTTSPYVAPPLNQCYTYAAFIGGSSASIPPSPVQRSSAKFTSCNFLN